MTLQTRNTMPKQNPLVRKAWALASQDWGPTLQRLARALAVACCAAYAAGWAAGRALHRLNDSLASGPLARPNLAT